MNKKLLIGIIAGIIIVIGALAIPKFMNKKEEVKSNNQNEVKKEEEKNNSVKSSEAKIFKEYFDTTSPIPVKKR